MSAINTIMSVMGINLDTLRPEPCVEGLVFANEQHLCDGLTFYPLTLSLDVLLSDIQLLEATLQRLSIL